MRKTRLASTLGIFLLTGCGLLPMGRGAPGLRMAGPKFKDDFASNGERIFLTSTNEAGDFIPYTGGPGRRGMMMGAYLTCAACHGADGRGGMHTMHMLVMDAPDIRYDALAREGDEHADGNHGDEYGEYGIEDFGRAVVQGQHPDGKPLSRDMPRWQMDDQDLAEVLDYLKSLP